MSDNQLLLFFCHIVCRICRNPTLQKIGRAEKAGSGVDKIISGWQSLGWPHPTVTEKTRPDYVVLTLQLEKKTQEVPTRKPDKKESRSEQIMAFCAEPKPLFAIMQQVRLKNRENLWRSTSIRCLPQEY